eukprot:TRINITY_DN32237_c0_g1_i1.p1 TRINITY_DN32237_c0_g1~~TRINITY_DN32237_c0_g1_i1.p1  ORF type:complete len:231 (+),score=35.56 TRINITY_DN32237_c0_g1_i1:92-784(+)
MQLHRPRAAIGGGPHRESREQQRARGWTHTIGFDDFEEQSMEAIDNNQSWKPKLGLYAPDQQAQAMLPPSGRQQAALPHSGHAQGRLMDSNTWGSLEDSFPSKSSGPVLRDAPARTSIQKGPRPQALPSSHTAGGPLALAGQGALAIGTTVHVKGLEQAVALNGRRGSLLNFDSESGRWQVDLGDGTVKAIRPDNLQVETSPALTSRQRRPSGMSKVAAKPKTRPKSKAK